MRRLWCGISHLSTSEANGWTLRDVPIMMSSLHCDMSCQCTKQHNKIKLSGWVERQKGGGEKRSEQLLVEFMAAW